MSSTSREILIIGGTGYLGTHLSERLSDEYMVLTSGRGKSPLPENSIYLDLLDPTTFSNIPDRQYSCVVFLAASITGFDTSSLVHQAIDINVTGLNNFLAYLSHHRSVKRILFTSSMTVYSPDCISPVIENDSTQPFHTYGYSKLLGEKAIEFYARNISIPYLILRIPGIFGGLRKSGYIHTLSSRMKKNEEVQIISKGLGIWETIEIHDLCTMISHLLAIDFNQKKYSIINIGYGQEIDFVETAYVIKDLLGSNSSIKIVHPVDYQKFFMSNNRLKELIAVDFSFLPSLKRFLATT